MLKATTLPLKSTGVLNKLVQDYVDGEPSLKQFYSLSSDIAGFKTLLDAQPYPHFDRKKLSEILKTQANSVKNTSEKTLSAITNLAEKNSFTVTTGHQLCLFTGPLYFVYKIFSTIRLCEKLKEEFPKNNFIPVYWMASEDHDFAEVNHLYANGQKLSWNSTQKGAVGHFKTFELKEQLSEFRKILGTSANSKKLVQLFEESYLGNENLAKATRHLVNALFGEYGLVTIDGDDHQLKSQFRSEFESDLFHHQPFEKVSTSAKSLEKQGYHSQVNAREINCFYLDKGIRTRIEKQGDNFRLVGTETVFSKTELEKILLHTPEKISPNVILRPMYQQKILPNLAYLGGPGELAYWLELKAMFDAHQIIFPILMPRNFVTVIDKQTSAIIQKAGLNTEDVFKNEQILLKDLQEKIHGLFELNKEGEAIKNIFAGISERTIEIDSTLKGKVAADLQRSLNALEAIAAKANKAKRKKMDVELQRIRTIKNALFPGGVPQERYENFAGLYLLYGEEFFDTLNKVCNPLLKEAVVITATQ